MSTPQAGYTALTSICDCSYYDIYRAIRDYDNLPVLLKIPKQASYTESHDALYEHEFNIALSLNNDSIVKPYALEKYGDLPQLVYEDPGGSFVENYLSSRVFAIEEILFLAEKAAALVRDIHNNNVIHKSIRPSAFIFNPESGKLKITDFSISTTLKREKPESVSYNAPIDFIYYISPEQSGRINRSIDYRTDLYSLGVFLYECFAEKRPFDSKNTLELVHSHIARRPPLVSEVTDKIPIQISNIIMKLLAKSPEERYQSAEGLRRDLEKCRDDILTQNCINDFPVAGCDIAEKFNIPEKLYGRETEIEKLLEVFENTGKGAVEVLAVTGYSGVGKSTLVHEISKPITLRKGFFISGKFDQFKRNIAYSAIVQAFRNLIKQLLGESEENLSVWKTRILSAIGVNGRIITDVIEEIKLIIGEQPLLPEVGPVERQNRFNLVFLNFVKLFTAREHPLVLFLDDLQWADSASLDLIKLIMSDKELNHFFMICAYRDNEVDNLHPAVIALDRISDEGVVIHKIILSPLNREDVNNLIADILHYPQESVEGLSDLVYDRTEGNPFFAKAFLQGLYDERSITFKSIGGWQWDMEQIYKARAGENVVDLMVDRMKTLPESSLKLIKPASCIGNSFTSLSVSAVVGKTIKEVSNDLRPLLDAGMIIYIQSLNTYRFIHDRVRESAYSLIPDNQRESFHLMTGRMLLKNLPDYIETEGLFEIVEQFNAGSRLITDKQERLKLAELNAKAGFKIKESNACKAAGEYFEMTLMLLPENKWDDHYDLTFRIHKEYGESLFLHGNFQKTLDVLENAFRFCRSDFDRGQLYIIRIVQCSARGEYMDAIQSGIKALAAFNIMLPSPDNEGAVDQYFNRELDLLKKRTGNKEPSDLLLLTINKERVYNLIMKIFSSIVECVFHAAPSYFKVIAVKMVNLSLEHGISAYTGWGCMAYALTLISEFQDYERAYKFGDTGLKIHEEIMHNRELTCRLYNAFGSFVSHWKMHVKESPRLLAKAYEAGLESGELIYTSYCVTNSIRRYISAGQNFTACLERVEEVLACVDKLHMSPMYLLNQMYKGFLLNLSGDSTISTDFDYNGFSEKDFIRTFSSSPMFLAQFDLYKLQNDYLLKDCTAAPERAFIDNSPLDVMMEGMEIRFYAGLMLISLYENSNEKEKEKFGEYIEKYYSFIRKCAAASYVNFSSPERIFFAEITALKGDVLGSMDIYDQAIDNAKKYGFPQYEALGNELAAIYWLKRGKKRFAGLYLSQALRLYEKLKAKAKSVQLTMRFQSLLGEAIIGFSRMENKIPFKSLDLITVIKASQAISGEVNTGRLMLKIMRIIIENAGAGRGFLILNPENDPVIECKAAVDIDDIAVLQSQPLSQCHELSESVVRYVIRTKKDVIMEDALKDELFRHDSYIIRKEPRSILCTPVFYLERLIAVLYLENNLTTNAFTMENVELLKMLLSQIAISLENSLLYDRLYKSSTKLEELNKNLKRKVAEEVERNREKDLLVLKQSRQATMGEILVNISHHWRQPLNAAGIMVQGIEDAYKYGELNERYLKETVKKTMNQLNHLSGTINNFRKVYCSNKKKEKFNLADALRKSIAITNDFIASYNITIELDIREDLTITGYPNDFSQAVIKILVNAVEILRERNVKNSQIKVRLYREEFTNNGIITISDNGGGIYEEPVDRVFDPYFSTKHMKQGTGIGLFMAKSIIENEMGAGLSVRNVQSGAEFKIEIEDVQDRYDVNHSKG